jgi:hypothetical protein
VLLERKLTVAMATKSPAAMPTLGIDPAPSAATAAETCTGCRVVINVATSSVGVTTTAAAGGPVVTESVTAYAIFSAFRVESSIAPPATSGAAVLGCAVTTPYTSTLAFPSSYTIPTSTSEGWDLAVASSFIKAVGVPACGPSAASVVLEGASDEVLNGTPPPTSSATSLSSSALTTFTTSTRAAAVADATTAPQPQTDASTSRELVQASIGIGVSIGLALVTVLALLLVRRHRRRRLGVGEKAGESESGFASKAELPARQLPEVDGSDSTREAASEPCYELDAGEVAKEKDG